MIPLSSSVFAMYVMHTSMSWGLTSALTGSPEAFRDAIVAFHGMGLAHQWL